ncbi:MAG: helix-turn-helix domain-containing protein [Candidatus Binataceae bacterium]
MAARSQRNIRKDSRSRRGSDDWPAAYIVAELRLRGWSLRKLSVAHGLGPTRLADVFRRNFPEGQEIVARALGVPASTLWPSRYAKQPAEARTVP